jgi:hypothetical protein
LFLDFLAAINKSACNHGVACRIDPEWYSFIPQPSDLPGLLFSAGQLPQLLIGEEEVF